LIQTGIGTIVEATLSGVPVGQHGFHIHQSGDCSDGGKAAGGHFNPHAAKHGMLTKDGPKKSHLGDLGNIVIGLDGNGRLDTIVPGVFLTGSKDSIAGRAFILHEKADDFGQPTGNAGARIGCGLIVIAK